MKTLITIQVFITIILTSLFIFASCQSEEQRQTIKEYEEAKAKSLRLEKEERDYKFYKDTIKDLNAYNIEKLNSMKESK